METIEQKAQDYARQKMRYALGLAPDCINRTDALIQKFCGRDIEEAYEDGATEALQSQWISVDEVLPGSYKNVLIVYMLHGKKVNRVAYYDEDDWCTLDGYYIQPTHWMPIPEIPDKP